MNRPFANEYCKVVEKEMSTLEGMGAQDIGEHKDDMNVINGTWAFKCK